MRWGGLTLIELIAVIATVGLLVAVLLPCLQTAQSQTRTIVCGSNIKQMILGLLTYDTENGTLPHAFDSDRTEAPLGGYAGHHICDRIGWWWFNHITSYMRNDPGSDSTVWCPARQVNNYKLERDVLCGNYAVNQSICKSSCGRESHAEFIGTPLRGTDISNPSQTLLLVDSGYSMITWWHVTDSPPISLSSIIEDTAYIPGLCINKDRLLWPGEEWDAINGRHPNRTVNVGFVDGHVSRTNADDLLVERAGDSYKNLSPLWLPK